MQRVMFYRLFMIVCNLHNMTVLSCTL